MNKQQLAAKIWESANQMRSKIEAHEYKDYILGFIFYKYLSEQQLRFVRSQGMSDAEIAQLNEADTSTVRYIQQQLGYFIAYDHLFSTWLEQGRHFDVANVRDALSAFNRLIKHKKLFGDIFDTLQTGLSKLGDTAARQTRAIRDLLQLIKDIPMHGRQDYDVLGYIYEYLISQFAANAGKKAGEFYTPHEVSVLMSEIIAHHLKDEQTIEIYDPTSGSGSLLINIGRSLAKHSQNTDNIKYYAQELKRNTYNLTRMNLVMRGIKPDNIFTRNADTLEEDWPYFDDSDPTNTYNPLYVNAVVSNPPYSQKWNPEHKESDPRYARFGLAPKTKADYAFLLHDLYHLKPDGIMIIVLPHGVLFRGGEEGQIRKQLIEYNHIETVIGLPANIFFGTGIPTIIMVLRQKRDNGDILMVDASKHFLKVGKNNKLQASDIKRIVDTVTRREARPKFSALISKATLRDNDYNLNIPRYVDSNEAAETWDLHAILHGGIPCHEIDQLAHYWQAFPELRASLFTADSTHSARLAVADTAIADTIALHPQVQAFNSQCQRVFADFHGYLQTALLTQPDAVAIAQTEETLSAHLFAQLAQTHCKQVALIDQYHAYQLFHDQWQSIEGDLEILHKEGMAAAKAVDAYMVNKKVRGEDTQVQDGWQGRILPFALVQQQLLNKELKALQAQENRLAEITAELAEILESFDEEEKEHDCIKENGDGFINAEVAKTAKAFSAEQENWQADTFEAKIITANDLIGEERAVKRSHKADSEALHLQTKATIESLNDAAVNDLLAQKWISPIINQLTAQAEQIIEDISQQVRVLSEKYATTLGDLQADIQESEKALAQMLGELTGSDADRQAIAELQQLLQGD